jgi:hypothetical protein
MSDVVYSFVSCKETCEKTWLVTRQRLVEIVAQREDLTRPIVNCILWRSPVALYLSVVTIRVLQ